MSIRELSTSFNRRDFVQDELQLDDFREGTGGDSSAWLEGHIASTGERYRTDRVHVVGLDRLREMRRRRALEGTRVSVWYLPKRGAWAAVDELVQFRVRSPEEFVQELPAGLIALNAAVALASVLLIRRGVGFPREAAT